MFLEDQLEPAEYVVLSPGDSSLPAALKDLPKDWKGFLASYRDGDYLLSVQFDPFRADLYAGNELAVSANRRWVDWGCCSRSRESYVEMRQHEQLPALVPFEQPD